MAISFLPLPALTGAPTGHPPTRGQLGGDTRKKQTEPELPWERHRAGVRWSTARGHREAYSRRPHGGHTEAYSRRPHGGHEAT